MPSAQIDISAKLKAFPYIAPAVTNAAAKAAGIEEELDDFISELEEESGNIPTDIEQIIGGGGTPGAGGAGKDEWGRMAVPIEDKLGWVSDLTSGMDSAFKKLDKVVTILSKILKILELFNSSFNSFSKLFVSVIDFAQAKINEFSGSLNDGVFAAVFAPPALLRKSAGNIDSKHQARGGFNGFLSRFENSLQNTKDANRPTFGPNAWVGGMVILLDTESLDQLWTGLKQLAAMFDFMQLLPINLSPPPPTNMRGFCGYFVSQEQLALPRKQRDPDAPKEFGVQVEWDNSFTSTVYHLYRSRIPGGQTVKEEFVPSSLVDNQETGEPGLLSVSFDLLSSLEHGSGTVKLPERFVQEYDDKDFNEGKPVTVLAPPNLTTLKYTDYEIKTEEIPGSDGIEFAYIEEEDGTKVPITNYYYMIRSATLFVEGSNSTELNVAIKTCNDNYNIADVVQHPEGRFEFLSIGAGKLNNWSSIQLSGMVPWYEEVIKMLNNFLDTLRGTVTDASDAFTAFLDHMISRIRMYGNILSLITWLIEQFKKFIFGPSLALLKLPPKKGGMPVFAQRIRQAKVPEDAQSGFSGPNGITVGIVLCYGATDAGVAIIKTHSAAFDLIESLLTEN